MNLKDYDDIDIYEDDEDFDEQETPGRAESGKVRRRKKGYGVFVFVIILFVLAVLVALGAAIYLLFFTKFDQNAASKPDKPIYTQAQMDEELHMAQEIADQRVAEAYDNGYKEGRDATLTSLMENLVSTGSSLTSLRPFYPDKVIVVSRGTFNFVDINRDLKQNDFVQEGFVTDDNGITEYQIDGETVTHKGIDVSSFQGDIDWPAVKADGVEFALIRAYYRGYGTGRFVEDEKAVNNIIGASSAGINIGTYVFSQAITAEEAEEEANGAIEMLQSCGVYGVPIVIDVEFTGDGGRMDELTPEDRTDIIIRFCDVVSAAGYKPYVYYNTEMSIMYVDLTRLEDIPKWYASYSSDFFYPYDIDILQYSATGRVNGIKGNVDLDIAFRTFWE